MLFNARSIDYKISVLWDFLAEQHIDLACVTTTRLREGETITLHQLPPLGFLVHRQSQEFGWRGCGITYPRLYSLQSKISGTECVGLVWLVYDLSNAPAHTLPKLLETVIQLDIEILYADNLG